MYTRKVIFHYNFVKFPRQATPERHDFLWRHPISSSTFQRHRCREQWPCDKASASRATDRVIPAFAVGIFSGSSHTSDLKLSTPAATLPGTWCYRICTGTGWPGVSILRLDEITGLICNLYLSAGALNNCPSRSVSEIHWQICWDVKRGLAGCLQHAGVSQGRICSDNCTCCHTETEVADQLFYLTQPQYTDTGSTSPSADPITPGAWQGSHVSACF